MGNPTHENVANNYDPLSLYARVYIRLLSLLFLNLAFVFPVWATPPAIFIDNPSHGKVLSGIVSCFGWAVGETHSIRDVQFFIDGGNKGLAIGYGGDREDVATAYPHVLDAKRSGFAVALNTRLLTNGPHTLDVVATNTNGETATISVDFLVSNAPGTENPSSVVLNVMSAQFDAMSPTEIMLTGVNLNGQPFDTVLLNTVVMAICAKCGASCMNLVQMRSSTAMITSMSALPHRRRMERRTPLPASESLWLGQAAKG